MLDHVAHIAIAVPDLDHACARYKILGFEMSDPMDQPDHGVRVVFIYAPNILIELMMPLDKTSPVTNFLEKHPNGGMHHLCFRTSNIQGALKEFVSHECRPLGDIKQGSHNLPVAFIHPKDMCGVLIELEEHPT